MATEYAQHVKNLPLVDVSLGSLRFALRWTFILSTLLAIVFIFSYFTADVEEQAGQLNSEDGSTIDLFILIVFAGFIFISATDWMWEAKRLFRRQGRKETEKVGFFRFILKGAIKLYLLMMAIPLLILGVGAIYFGYLILVESALVAFS